jgi:hypothetical protein
MAVSSSSSFVCVFTGMIAGLSFGTVCLSPSGTGAVLDYTDVEVRHCQDGVCVPLTFRMVGAMACHWGRILLPGAWVTLSGTLCVEVQDGVPVSYYLVTGVVPFSGGLPSAGAAS